MFLTQIIHDTCHCFHAGRLSYIGRVSLYPIDSSSAVDTPNPSHDQVCRALKVHGFSKSVNSIIPVTGYRLPDINLTIVNYMLQVNTTFSMNPESQTSFNKSIREICTPWSQCSNVLHCRSVTSETWLTHAHSTWFVILLYTYRGESNDRKGFEWL